MKKLTLNADPDVIDLARQLAEQHGTSVSDLFSQIIRSMANPERVAPVGPKTRLALGLVRMPSDKTIRELIEEALDERSPR